MIEEFLGKWFDKRHGDVLKHLLRLKTKISNSELETYYPKHNHSLVATKDFVFITGGDYKIDDKTFEILCVKDKSLFRGPDLKVTRHSHCSFVFDDYLYVALGAVRDGCSDTMSYERIEIPSVFSKDDLKSFYLLKEWTQGSIKIEYAKISYFKCFNSLK